ncbi:MAG: hypothetical protein Q9175_004724 [Cornicularia normoerica]
MAPSDDDPGLSESPTIVTTPFTIAARSTNSAKYLWNAATQRAVVLSKSSQKRPAQVPTPQASDDDSSLVTIPSSLTESSDVADVMDEEIKSSEDSTPEVSLLPTPGPGSSVSQTSETSNKRSRAKTSHVHEYISTQGSNFVCNRCSKVYKCSGGTGAISRHLKKAHSIDSTASGIARKKTREQAAIDAAILRGSEDNTKAEETREELMRIDLNKTTLEHLYFRWVKKQDHHFELVRDTAFRTFLEYVNPVANEMLPDLIPP